MPATTPSQSDPDLPVASLPVPGVQPAQGDHDLTQRALAALDAAEAGLTALEEDLRAGATSTPKKTALKVSIVIPVYNERDTICEIVERVRAANCHHQIVIVDDASTDGTRDVLLQYTRDPDVEVLLHGYNKGKGAALHTAFTVVRGDIILIQDADLEYNPSDYQKLLAPIERGEADVVYGSRFLENARQDPSWLHRFGNRMLTWLSNRTTGLDLTDMETCYKVFRTGALRGMQLRERRFGFEPELTAKLARRRCRFQEVPVSYNSRGYAEGKKINYRDGLRALYCILRYAWVD